MATDKYVVRPGGVVEPCDDLMESARWFESAGDKPFEDGGRIVGRDTLPDGTRVSTVFLWIDHAFNGGTPILFETMVFDCPVEAWADWQDRYHTVEEARAGHAAVIERLRRRLGPDEPLDS